MMLIQKGFKAVIVLLVLQSCAGGSGSSDKVVATSSIDTASLPNGASLIAQSLSVAVPPPVTEPTPPGILIPPTPAPTPIPPIVSVPPTPAPTPIPPIVSVPPVDSPICKISDDEDDKDRDGDLEDHRHSQRLGSFTQHFGSYKDRDDDDENENEGRHHKNVSCKQDKEDPKQYCDDDFISKHLKKGFKDFKFKIVDSDDQKIENEHGNLIVVASHQHSLIHSIKNFDGKMILCGVHVLEIKHTHGHVALSHSDIDDMDDHDGHLELDHSSRVKRINNTRCTLNKRDRD